MTPDRDIILAARQGRVATRALSTWPATRGTWLHRLGRSNALTMIVSVGLHAALFLSFYRVVFVDEGSPRRVVIPEARLAPAGAAGAARSPGEMPRLTPPPAAAGARTASAGLAGASPLQLSELPVVAVNLTGSSGLVVGGTEGTPTGTTGAGVAGGSLLGTGYGTGAAGGGGGLLGPATSFFGAVGNAYRVVYVVDISNSLMSASDEVVRSEMKRAVQALSPSQEFLVILSTPLRIIELASGRLMYATAANKLAAARFIETHVRRGDAGIDHSPSVALRRAFELRPELVYFLSDGDYHEQEKINLKALLKEKSPRGEIKLTVLGFGYGGDYTLLEQLARQTGGNYRYLDYK